jgi:hypothetical protein
MNFIYDIINLEFVVVVSFLAVAYYLRSEPLKVLLLFGHILVIFFLNDVLFSPTYFGDQLRQVDATKLIRGEWFDTGEAFGKHGSKMGFASLIYAAIPLPFINSVQSLAMINFLIFVIILVFIKRNNISSNSVDYFYLLFPSLLLYSSLALRDTLVLLFMIIGLYVILIREKILLGLLLSSPIIIFKFQNYLMVIAAILLFYYLKNAGGLRYGVTAFFIIIAAFIPEKVPVVAQLYERLETWRLALFYDQYMYNWQYIKEMNIDALYEPLGTGLILLYQIVKYFFYMLLKPLPWECDNPFQFIQSAENLVIFGMIIWINRKKVFNEKIREKILFLNCLLFVSMTINGLVVFNFGSAVRYKFPFVVVYFVFFLYFIRSDRSLVNQVKSAWSSGADLRFVKA